MDNTLGVIEKLKDSEILKSMSIGERLAGALTIMVLGMLTCIVVLALIMIIIKIMHKIMEKSAAKAAGRSVQLVTSPLTGTVISTSASAGKTVAKGELLLTLHWAQGDTEVCAPDAGAVSDVKVKTGDSVNAGDVLLVVEGKKAAV